MLQYFEKYYYFVVLGLFVLACIIFIILFLLKRLNVKHLIKLVSIIPAFVASAENVFPFGFGENKKQIVFNLVESLASELHLTKYLKYIDISAIIEDTLTAPQKKGDVVLEKENVTPER